MTVPRPSYDGLASMKDRAWISVFGTAALQFSSSGNEEAASGMALGPARGFEFAGGREYLAGEEEDDDDDTDK